MRRGSSISPLTIAMQAHALGRAAFVMFTVVHWLCDLVWLEALSWASHQGSRIWGLRTQRVVLRVCAAALIFFAGVFLYKAGRKWVAPSETEAAARRHCSVNVCRVDDR